MLMARSEARASEAQVSVQKGRPIGVMGKRVVCRCVRGGVGEAGAGEKGRRPREGGC